MKKLVWVVGLAASIGFIVPSMDAGARAYRTQSWEYEPGARPRRYEQRVQPWGYQQGERRRKDWEAQGAWRSRDEGVRGVRYRIEVNPELARYRPVVVDDATLARQIAQRIVQVVFVGATAREDWPALWRIRGPSGEWDLEIEVDDGHVKLDGDVPTERDMRQVIMAVRTAPGVRSVASKLEVHRFDPYDRPLRFGVEEPYGVFDPFPDPRRGQ